MTTSASRPTGQGGTDGAASHPSWRFILRHPAHFLAFGLGAGLSPKAPGTAGTLVAFPIFFILLQWPEAWMWAAIALALGLGPWICGRASQGLGVHDHGGIVWDEIAAFLLVLPFAPPTPAGYALAFVLFRLFDIWKPFPIGWLDRRVDGGLGIMLDDVVAAGYTWVFLEVMNTWR
jgi:phosphatidylglycerophosphatase A